MDGVLAIIGGFICSRNSVIIQVVSYRVTTKIFKMAPIHHHLRRLGKSTSGILDNSYYLALVGLAIKMGK